MPKIDFKLASERLKIAGGSDPIRGTSFNAQNFRVSTPRINADAANIRFTPVQPPEIVVDQTLNAIANTANVFTQAAFKFQEAEAQAKADQKILQYDLAVDQLKNKYKGLLGQAAVEGYSAYEQQIKQLTQQVIGSESDYVKAKMIPALAQIQNKSLLDGASHKATELRTWQGNILENQQLNTRNKILEVSGDANGVQQVEQIVKEQLIGFDNSPLFQGRSDALKVVKQKFLDEFAKDVIDYHTKIGNFERAMDYIKWAGDNNVSPEVIGTEYAQLNTAIDKQITDKRTQERLDRLDRERAIEEGFKKAIVQAVKSENRTALDMMFAIDPKLHHSYSQYYEDFMSERPLTAEEEAQLRQIEMHPDSGRYPELFSPFGKKGLESFNRKQGALGVEFTRVRRQAANFLESVFPQSADAYIRNPARDSVVNDLQELFESSLRAKENSNKSYDEILFEWKERVLTNPYYNEEDSGFVIHRPLLKPVSSGDFLTYEALFESGELTNSDLENKYDQLSDKLLRKYGVEGLTENQAYIELRKTGNIQSFQQDSINLNMQYRYFRQDLASGPKTAAEYDKTQFQNLEVTPPDKREK